MQTRNELVDDSIGLYEAISRLHEGKEYGLRQTVQRTRDSFEGKENDLLMWIPGTRNIAVTLSKNSRTLWKLLDEIDATGMISTELDTRNSLDSNEWQ